MREIRLSGSEGGEGFNPLSLPLSERKAAVFMAGEGRVPPRPHRVRP